MSLSLPAYCLNCCSALRSVTPAHVHQPALSFFIFLTQMAVIAQRMCWVSLLCNSTLLFRLPLCTKEENMYWLNSLFMYRLLAGRGGLGHRTSRGPAASLPPSSPAWEYSSSSLPPAFLLQKKPLRLEMNLCLSLGVHT